MAKRKNMAIVIGAMKDVTRNQWAPGARAYATAKDVVMRLGPNDSCFDDLAYELRTTRENLLNRLEEIDHVEAMEALIRVIQLKPGIAIKTFNSLREAESFLDLIEQISDKQEKGRI